MGILSLTYITKIMCVCVCVSILCIYIYYTPRAEMTSKIENQPFKKARNLQIKTRVLGVPGIFCKSTYIGPLPTHLTVYSSGSERALHKKGT